MGVYHKGTRGLIYYKGKKMGVGYQKGILIYKSSRPCTIIYNVDIGTQYTEIIEEGMPILMPDFNPTKVGYDFVGWRYDNQPINDPLADTVASEDVVLYAVFKKTITLTYYDNSTTAKTKKETVYYNNGNISEAEFTMTQAAASGWTARGWSTKCQGDADINYDNGSTIAISEDLTIYGLYEKTITVTYYDGSTTAKTKTGVRYCASGGEYINPSFTLAQTTKSGWTKLGWSTGTAGNSSITYNDNTKFTRESNVTLYGMYSQSITVTYYNNSTSASTTNGTRYWNSGKNVYTNPSFTLSQASKSGWTARGWSTTNAGDATATYTNGATFTRESNITLYGMYYKTVTLSYAGNGASSGSVSSHTGTVYWAPAGTVGAKMTLKSNGFSRADAAVSLSWGGDGNAGGNATESYAFNGWNLGAAGASVTITSDTTASAQWRKSKLYIKFHNGTGINLPWSADSWTTVNLSGLSTMSVSTSTWTRDGCDEPDWRIYLGGSHVMTIGGNSSGAVSTGGRGSCQLRLNHPEVWYNDGYSHGDSTVYLTFT